MMVLLYKVGAATPEVDVTAKLMNEEQELTQEIERQAFQRTYDDVTLHFSNLRDYFTALFSDTVPTTRWLVTVYSDSNRRIFKGYMDNETLVFSPDDKTVEFTAFHVNKQFWERAKETFLFITGPPFNWYVDYFTLEQLIQGQIANTAIRGDLFSTTDLGEYTDRQIRMYSDNSIIGNQGRFKELALDTTFEELLLAMGQYYNAEFFINPETDNLTMRRRGAVLNDLQTDIGPTLLRKPEPKATWLDDERVDYLYSFSIFDVQPQPVILEYFDTFFVNTSDRDFNSIVPNTIQGYRIVDVMSSGLEQFSSVELVIVTPQVSPEDDPFQGWVIRMRIPPATVDVVERRLYRFDTLISPPAYRLVASWQNNTEIAEFDDAIGQSQLVNNQQLVSIPVNFGNGWVRFNETTGLWETPIIDDGNAVTRPTGRIFNIAPQLRFRYTTDDPATPDIDERTEEKPTDPYDVFSFFARDTPPASPIFQAQWEPMFRSRRRLLLGVKRTDLRVGDSITYATIAQLPDDWTPNALAVVRKARVQLKQKESLIEAVTV